MADNEVRAALLGLLVVLVPMVGKFLAMLIQYQTAIVQKMLGEMQVQMKERQVKQNEISDKVDSIITQQNGDKEKK